jgi:hypothetical protein
MNIRNSFLVISGKLLMKAGMLFILLLLLGSRETAAQKRSDDIYLDAKGVMRWGNTKEEVRAFGINYTAMFAHAYRTAKKLNISLEKAIDEDVYHFARLGFDAFRVHVWDTEISDSVGNLLENDHLRLFDYTLKKMKDRGMKFVITPIAFWGNGWPERDEKTPGFSFKYGKDKCLTDPGAIRAQETYLYQFLNHVNAYTGVAYKNDPDILAFEISNEPHHQEEAQQVTTFINRMVKAMRNTGTKKLIFYNISHSIHLVQAYLDADIQGGTFQWYPTGLGAGHELRGNLLLNVEKYTIPFADDPKFKKSAKIVYEFDAADVGRSYIYPAMARSFRTAGMQVATHFAYDPTFMADVNTEYGTHYMNLAYAPQKALSLMIASEVFHRIPMYKDFGSYPGNTTFGEFRVSYENDLAEMISPAIFLYTNATSSKPKATEKLEKIAGFGNSPVVSYEGLGAYFLDKLENGVWRLEVMPDALWKHDPFERTSPKKKVAFINWRSWPMVIDLPDLGEQFSVKAVNDGNTFSTEARQKSFVVSPGTYLVVKKGIQPKIKPDDRFKNIVVKEFAAPATSLVDVIVKHQPVKTLTEGSESVIDAVVYSKDTIQSVDLFVSAPSARIESIPMERKSGYNYQVTVPSKFTKLGNLRYHIVVKRNNVNYSYPSGLQTHPWDWDFYDRSPYATSIVPETDPVFLFSAASDADELIRPWLRNSSVVPGADGSAELRINVEKLFVADPENKNARKVSDYSIRLYTGTKTTGRKNDAITSGRIVFRGRSLDGKPCKVQVALVAKNGDAFGGILTLGVERKDYSFNMTELRPVKLISLPRPYPTFLQYYIDDPSAAEFNLNDLEGLQISIGPGMTEDELKEGHGIAIESVRLE